MVDEEWRPVVGWEGLYEVSDQGRVKALDRVVRSKGGTRVFPGRIKRQQLMSTGRYLTVALCRPQSGKSKTHSVHRLVLEAFAGPCPFGMEGCHGPRGSLDNWADNLRWDTRQANIDDTLKHGTRCYGERTGHAKLTAAQVRRIRRLYGRGGTTYDKLAAQFGVTTMTVCRLVLRQSWAHIP